MEITKIKVRLKIHERISTAVNFSISSSYANPPTQKLRWTGASVDKYFHNFRFFVSQFRNISFLSFATSNIIISIAILLFVIPGCRLFSPSGSGVIPQIRIVEPQEGDTIRTANVLIKVEVTSNENILKVRFFDDNLFLGEVSTHPFDHFWETAYVSNGEHNLSAEAVDESGNTGKSPHVTVFVTKEESVSIFLFINHNRRASDYQR